MPTPALNKLWVGLLLGAQLSTYTAPIPLNRGAQDSKSNANNIIFFKHPVIPGSTGNFKIFPSVIRFDGNTVQVDDVAGAPGYPPRTPNNTNWLDMLATEYGLCYENFLPNVTCPKDFALSHTDLNQPSWDHLVADLRHTLPGEANVPNVALPNVILSADPRLQPYDVTTLGSVKADFSAVNATIESPDAIGYNIVSADDWLAIPVFGKVYVRPNPTIQLTTITNIETGKPFLTIPVAPNQVPAVELQSPIILYRSENNGIYKLAGYLTNPSIVTQLLEGLSTLEKLRFGTPYFPIAIAAGNFEDQPPNPKGFADIAVMSTATLPHSFCKAALDKFKEAGRGDLEHGLDCSYGYTWVRTNLAWKTPRDTFDSQDILFSGPKVYDMAAGNDKGKAVLFAPSNAPSLSSKGGTKFYVYKYYEAGMDPIGHQMFPAIGQLIPPRAIEVLPPVVAGKTFGPFKIAVDDINNDGYADFALTWKDLKDDRIDTGGNIWASHYSPYVSIYVSSFVDGKIHYSLVKDFQVPQVNAAGAADQAELAAVSFGQKGNQKFLVVGNQKRILVDGKYQAFDYLFPVADGVVDDVNVKIVQASFQDEDAADAPGVADVTTDPNGNVGSLMRRPFLPAPEGCDVNNGEVYGIHWIMDIGIGPRPLLDINNDGVPNRCECHDPKTNVLILPDESNDPDMDEIPNACDTCPNNPNQGDHETLKDGTPAPDGVDDACDNCPPVRCQLSGLDHSFCVNHDQADRDGDGVGDKCDICPDKPNPSQAKLYGFFQDSQNPINYCSYCMNGYTMANGTFYRIPAMSNDPAVCGNPLRPRNIGPQPDDADGDGVPDERDNCVYVPNPSDPALVSPQNPSGQPDSDNDGSGDACDCPNAGARDDCDGDGVPNRFDREPLNPFVSMRTVPATPLQMADSVYDPEPRIIADRKDLRMAQATTSREFNVTDLLTAPSTSFSVLQQTGVLQRIVPPSLAPPAIPTGRCGMPAHTWPGPIPCDNMGSGPRELTVVLPKQTPPGCDPSKDPNRCGAITSKDGFNTGPFCISRVGRENPKTAALFEKDQKIIQEANDRVQGITGIKNFDLFVGGEVGILHWECAFMGGAFPSASKATGILPDVSGNMAPFAVWQTAGLPPLEYKTRPIVDSIQPLKPLRLAPLDVAPAIMPAGGAPASSFSLMPDVSTIVPSVSGESVIAKEGVQVSARRYNIHGKVLVKALNATDDFASEGTYLSVSDVQSLMVLDFKAYPEPPSSVPIEDRKYNFEEIFKELVSRVQSWKSQGKPITIEIYRDLPWSAPMRPEFLIVQGTVPGAIDFANKSLAKAPKSNSIGSADLVFAGGAEPLPEGVNLVHLNAVILPPGLFLSGSGCGCNFAAPFVATLSLAALIFILPPFVILLYCRRRLSPARTVRKFFRKNRKSQ